MSVRQRLKVSHTSVGGILGLVSGVTGGELVGFCLSLRLLLGAQTATRNVVALESEEKLRAAKSLQVPQILGNWYHAIKILEFPRKSVKHR